MAEAHQLAMVGGPIAKHGAWQIEHGGMGMLLGDGMVTLEGSVVFVDELPNWLRGAGQNCDRPTEPIVEATLVVGGTEVARGSRRCATENWNRAIRQKQHTRAALEAPAPTHVRWAAVRADGGFDGRSALVVGYDRKPRWKK